MFCVPSIHRLALNCTKKKVRSALKCPPYFIYFITEKSHFIFYGHSSWTVIKARFVSCTNTRSYCLPFEKQKLQKKRTKKAPLAACGNQSFFSVRFCWGDRKMPEPSTFFSKQNSTTFFPFSNILQHQYI